MRKQDDLAVGGFDEALFPNLLGSVDFCLRLGAAGKRTVITPHARLIHHEPADRADALSPERLARSRRETEELRRRWGNALAADPHYSPLLNLDAPLYAGLAWPPRPDTPRFSR